MVGCIGQAPRSDFLAAPEAERDCQIKSAAGAGRPRIACAKSRA
jgi:hypothetical protein